MDIEKSKRNAVQCAEEAIICGGGEFVRWVHKYIFDYTKDRKCVLHLLVMAVPQIGDSSGKLLTYPKDGDSQVFVKSNRVFEDFIHDVYEDEIMKTQRKIDGNELTIFRFPIGYGFGKPIGSIFLVTKNPDLDIICSFKTHVDNLSFLIRAVKIQFAFKILSDNFQNVLGDSDEISKTIIENAKSAIGSKDVSLWRITPDGNLMEIVVATKPLSVDMEVGAGLAGTCAQKGISIRVDDLQNEEETTKYCLSGVEHKKLVKKMGWHAACFMPISLQRFSAGVFAVYSGRKGGLNDLDYLIAKAFASQMEYAYTLNETEKLLKVRNHLITIAPAMDAAIDAVGNLHDADDELFDALNSIGLLQEHLGEKQKDMLLSVKENIKEASRLVKKFKDDVKFSKAGKFRFKYKNVRETISPVVLRTKTAAFAKGIDLKFSCPENIECEFDVERIRRAIRNVLENSIDFLSMVKQKPKIIYFRIRQKTECGKVEFIIEDNGPGIDPDVRDSIFDIFFTTKDKEGFGLGLNMTLNTIKGHNGKIDVDSRIGKGSYTRIILSIPILQ